MPKNNQHYRLLNEGETIREGDEWYSPTGEIWTAEEMEVGDAVGIGGYPVRRPLNHNPEAVPLMLEALETELTTAENNLAALYRFLANNGQYENDRRTQEAQLKATIARLRPVLAAAKERGAE